MGSMSRTIFTIGYEGATLDAFITTLELAGVERVIDVRDVPASRKRGFSKTALSAALGGAGIEYHHLKALGDPKPGRDAMRRGDKAEFLRVYSAHVAGEAAQESLQKAVDLSSKRASALLCYERDPKDCHRTIVAELMTKSSTFAIRHLGVASKVTGDGRSKNGADERAVCGS